MHFEKKLNRLFEKQQQQQEQHPAGHFKLEPVLWAFVLENANHCDRLPVSDTPPQHISSCLHLVGLTQSEIFYKTQKTYYLYSKCCNCVPAAFYIVL